MHNKYVLQKKPERACRALMKAADVESGGCERKPLEYSGNLRGLLWCFGHTEEWKSVPAAPLGSRCVGRLQAQLRMFSRVQP